MIIRSLALRHGRFALPRCSFANRRTLTTTPSLRRQQQREERYEDRLRLPTDVRDPDHPVARDFVFFQHQKVYTQNLGTALQPHYRPRELVSNPPRPQDVTLELLMASQAHIGHATSLWHPANAKYIFGVRGRHDPIHIISLDVTAAYLRRASKIVRGVTSRGGLVLFVGTRDGQVRTVVKAAELSKGCHLFTNWIPGTITNGQQILGACAKKVVDENDKSIPGFGDQLPQSSAIKPDLVVCLNPLENYTLLHECGLHHIPTIGIVDTDVNPGWVTYPIPANDDSLRCVQIICGVLGRAGEEGQSIRKAKAQNGIVVSMPSHGLDEPTSGQVERDLATEERARLVEIAVQEELRIEADAAAAEQARLRAARKTNDDAAEEEVAYLASLEDSGSSEAAMRARSMREEESEIDDWQYDEEVPQPYERDRPLTQEELSQASTGGATGMGLPDDVNRDRDGRP